MASIWAGLSPQRPEAEAGQAELGVQGARWRREHWAEAEGVGVLLFLQLQFPQFQLLCSLTALREGGILKLFGTGPWPSMPWG